MNKRICDVNPKIIYDYIRNNMDDEQKNRRCSILHLDRLLLVDGLRDACSCHDCRQKLQKLQIFETDIIYLAQIVQNYWDDVDDKHTLLTLTHATLDWTVYALNSSHNQLAAIDSKLERSPSHSKIEDSFKQLTKDLLTNHLISDCENDPPSDIEMDDDDFKVGVDWYTSSLPDNEEILALINKVQMIGQTPEVDVKKKIEDRIRLMKQFPIQDLFLQAEKLVNEIGPMREKADIFDKAKMFLDNTCVRMNKIQSAFCSSLPKMSVQEHTSNGVNRILQSLVNMVDSFHEEWKLEYAHFFTSYDTVFTPSLTTLDRSEPKRQKIE